MPSTKNSQYSNIKLSVFFPAFNEELNIKNTVEKAVKVIKGLEIRDWEILIINDGSRDKTAEIADQLSKKDSRIKVIYQENGGYGKALRSGFDRAKYDWVVFTDSDGQFDFSEVNKFLDKTAEIDYIIGYRMKRADNLFRLLAGKVWALSVFFLFGIWVKDIDCGFRMIRKSVLEKISKLESTRGAMINAEILIKVKKKGFKITQIGVHHYPRVGGVPTGVRLNVIIKSYFELFKLWWKLR